MSIFKKTTMYKKNKYLIDIPHPHFAHFFKNLINQLGTENVVITCQDSGIITKILQEIGFDYIIIGKKFPSLIQKAYGQILYFGKYFSIIKQYKITHVLGTSPSLSLAAKILKRKMIFFDDDDSAVQPLTKKLTVPLANYIITPECLLFENYGKRHHIYKGFQELAYLSPNCFTPDKKVIEKYGLKEKEYFIVRFNDFVAHHDLGHSGIPFEIKHQLIDLLLGKGKVFITSESPLQDDFIKYQLKIDPIDIHHVLAFAKLYIGDSQTMTSESAVLGTPSIRCNSFKDKISYLSLLEKKYGLTYSFATDETDLMLKKINELLDMKDIDRTFENRRWAMLSDMEDVNEFIFNFLQKC